MCVCVCVCVAEQEGLGISSYGISVTTMEEVFMKVRDGADKSILHRYAMLLKRM